MPTPRVWIGTARKGGSAALGCAYRGVCAGSFPPRAQSSSGFGHRLAREISKYGGFPALSATFESFNVPSTAARKYSRHVQIGDPPRDFAPLRHARGMIYEDGR